MRNKININYSFLDVENNFSITDAAHCVGEKRNLVSVQHQPSGHPAQSQNTEYQKRAWTIKKSHYNFWKYSTYAFPIGGIFLSYLHLQTKITKFDDTKTGTLMCVIEIRLELEIFMFKVNYDFQIHSNKYHCFDTISEQYLVKFVLFLPFFLNIKRS